MTIPTSIEPSARGRKVLTAQEYGPIDVDPGDVIGPDGRLALTPGVLGKYVRADFKNNELRLSAMGVTGLIPLTDRLTVQVRPRFPLRNLTYMVSVCGYTPTVLSALREYTSTDQFDDWMLDVMADALIAAFETITLNGLLRTYHRRTEVSSYPHGRIDTTATLLRLASRGINHLAQYSWFERTIDNPPNRCLKSAMTMLHRRYLRHDRHRGSRARIAKLGEALRVLHTVTLEPQPFSLDDQQVRGTLPLPETRNYYRPALELAIAILTGRGISLDASTGTISMQSLLVKTEDLFEEFVRLSLQRSLAERPGLFVLDGNNAPGKLPLYEDLSPAERALLPDHAMPQGGKAPEANPDIVFRLEDGSHPVVFDVKYTEVHSYTPRSEMEQVLLYGLRYRSPVALTIHPLRSGTPGLHIAGRIGTVIVAQYRVDLAAQELDAEMEKMALCIAEFISS
ncbi:hypothetical protein AB0P23_24050 [Rhodococcus sp. NPDC077669]|uniref:5-methylcytosine restriction system specificity protein McrC n=1 Tax=Rhodococcus sp. NPDC077669 TaxID=3155174 RepID=UPI00343D1784